MTEDFILRLAVRFVEPISQRSPLTASRLAVLADGTTMPVLALLAREKFGGFAESERFPFWIDGNYLNEMLSNVDLATRTKRNAAPKRRRRSAKASYGAPSGTPEYMRAWRVAHRDSVQAAQRRYNKRRRDGLTGVAKQVLPSAKPAEPPSLTELVEDDEVPAIARLAEAVASTSPSASRLRRRSPDVPRSTS
jgi:hypothetical protein